MDAPVKEVREKCWKARDEYWNCLEKNNEAKEKCLEIRKIFEKQCSKQWIKHFDRKRDYELYKAKLDEKGWFVNLSEEEEFKKTFKDYFNKKDS